MKKMVLTLLAAMLLAGCADDGQVGVYDGASTVGLDNGDIAVAQTDSSYSYPEFLDSGALGLYGSVSYTSFDAAAMTAQVAQQPFPALNCVSYFTDLEVYSYRDAAGKYGIATATGGIALEAAYDGIALVRPDVLALTDGKTVFYVKFNAKGDPVVLQPQPWFLQTAHIRINTATDQNDNTVYDLSLPDGNSADGKYWDEIEELPADSITLPAGGGNKAKIARAFSLVRGDTHFVITFDTCCNFTVYDGCYASIHVRVGSRAGTCYVLGYDDFRALQALIASFGEKPVEEAELAVDEIEITFYKTGSATDADKIVTVTTGGACTIVTDVNTDDEKTRRTAYDKLAFTDLIRFVSGVVAEEYGLAGSGR
ncbi:MAG: hypothetical protein QM689_05945 [Oscillospiraceae bacterium]